MTESSLARIVCCSSLASPFCSRVCIVCWVRNLHSHPNPITAEIVALVGQIIIHTPQKSTYGPKYVQARCYSYLLLLYNNLCMIFHSGTPRPNILASLPLLFSWLFYCRDLLTIDRGLLIPHSQLLSCQWKPRSTSK